MRILSSLLIIGIISILPLQSASAILSIGISPLRAEITVDPGDTITHEFEVFNQGNESIVLIPNVKEARVQDEQGNSTFVNPDPDDIQSLPNWISFQDPVINVSGQSKAKTKITIRVPEVATPGGHYAMILYKPSNTNAPGVQVSAQIGALILLKVRGDIIESGELLSFLADQDAFYEDQAIKLAARFENKGSVHLKPSGKIYITDQRGKPVDQVSEYIDPISKKSLITDYLPINLKRGNILPGTIREFAGEWNRNRKNGKFTASLNLNLAENLENIAAATQFELEEAMEISKLHYDKAQKLITLEVINTGNVYLKPRGLIKIYNDLDFQVDEVPFPAFSEYLKPAEAIPLEIKWDKKISPGYYYLKTEVVYGSQSLMINETSSFYIGSFFAVFLSSQYGVGLMMSIILILLVIIYRRPLQKFLRHL